MIKNFLTRLNNSFTRAFCLFHQGMSFEMNSQEYIVAFCQKETFPISTSLSCCCPPLDSGLKLKDKGKETGPSFNTKGILNFLSRSSYHKEYKNKARLKLSFSISIGFSFNMGVTSLKIVKWTRKESGVCRKLQGTKQTYLALSKALISLSISF